MTETDFARSVSYVNIEDEMKQSYMDYAMSVIVGRALPDVRDGLKPVHRRVLHAMNEMGNDYNKPYKKSARIVGDVIGKYHPHGDTAVYDTIVRMAQPFSLRYVLVDGQGNFGSVDGDAPAAMRYTEIRMSRIAHELLEDIDKETVDFVPNYDGSEDEPTVLPSRIPNLLVNGSSGIAVGMATNIPPHNLSEVIRATLALIDNPEIGIADLVEIMPGPDFPTAGIINGTRGIQEAYVTGRGRIRVRARTEIEQHDKGDVIIVTELPYQVNKAELLKKIAELVKDKKISGIRQDGLRDESDKDGMRIVIELKKGEVAEVLLNNLYKYTRMQTVFGINMVALIDGQPRVLNLKEILSAFVAHRREVVTRRTLFELRKARNRAHILEGLAVALANIDPIIELIKTSSSPADAKEKLLTPTWQPGDTVSQMLERAGASATRPDGLPQQFGLGDEGYRLSPQQAQAILDLRLQKLTGLEQDKILKEYGDIIDVIADLLDILGNPDRLMQVIRDELNEIDERYGDDRVTEIIEAEDDLTMEDLITEEDVVVTLSHAGYAKCQPIDTYRSQKRGGKGKAATSVRDEDFVDKLFIANTHDTLLCFSSYGKLYWLKVYQLPQASRTARGKPLVNLLPLEEDERINAILPIREFSEDKFLFMATADGTVKKTALSDFARQRSSGLRAIELVDGNQLIGVEITDGDKDVMIFSNVGKVARFHESDVRPMGRTAKGVRGIKLSEGQTAISLIIVNSDAAILTATENGFGKRTEVADYPTKGRGGQGVISIQTSERNGNVVGAVAVEEQDEVMLISSQGTLIRSPVKDISIVGRNTQGVRLVNLSEGEKLAGLERVLDDGEEEE